MESCYDNYTWTVNIEFTGMAEFAGVDKRTWLLSLALVFLTLVAYSPLLFSGFINDLDDDLYVTENEYTQAGLSAAGLRWAMTAFHAHNWHPLTWLSLQLDTQVFGTKAWGYHLTNLLLHLANVLLLFAVLRRMTGAVDRSAVVAALFAVHPLHVESVAWIAERKDVLSTLFWMLTLWAYVRYTERRRIGRYLLVVFFFALGLMAKPMLVTLPCVLLLLDYWPLKRRGKGEGERGKTEAVDSASLPPSPSPLPPIWEKVPLFLLAAACCVTTMRAQEHLVRPLEQFSVHVRLLNALTAYTGYLGQTFWPAGLSFFYPHAGAGLPAWKAAWSGLLLAAITATAIWNARRRPYLMVGWLWFLGTLVPVLGLVQVGFHARADRYTYVPLIGVFIMLAWGVPDLVARWRWARSALVPVTVGLLVACAIITGIQATYWQTSADLWQHALDVEPNNYFAHDHLGEILLKDSKNEPLKIEQARQHFAEAVRLQPDNAWGPFFLGLVLVRQGKLDEAIRSFQATLALAPAFFQAQFEWGQALDRQGKPAEAIEHYQEAIRLQPEYVEALLGLGVLLRRQGKLPEAAEQFAVVTQVRPRYAEGYYQLGFIRERQGRPDDALEHYRQAVRLAPRQTRYHCRLARALNAQGQSAEAAEQYREATRLDPRWLQTADQEARLLATHPDPLGREGPRAVDLAEQVCQATDHQQATYLDTLAAAYAEVGRFEDARATVRQALALVAGRQPHWAAVMQQRLQLYKNNRPLRNVGEMPSFAGQP